MKLFNMFRVLVLAVSPRIIDRGATVPFAVGALLIGSVGFVQAQATSGITGTVTWFS